MTDNTVTEWNVWRVWIHPRKALFALDEADIMENELTRRLEEAMAEAERLREESSRQTLHINDLSQRLEETLGRLKETEEELSERKDTETQLREFDSQLKKIEEMKRGYERRIRDLEMRLRDATAKPETDDDKESELLAPAERIPVRNQPPADDWLMELPEDL